VVSGWGLAGKKSKSEYHLSPKLQYSEQMVLSDEECNWIKANDSFADATRVCTVDWGREASSACNVS
jgi:hypothetical protein